jgi:stress-induced morphogen
MCVFEGLQDLVCVCLLLQDLVQSCHQHQLQQHCQQAFLINLVSSTLVTELSTNKQQVLYTASQDKFKQPLSAHVCNSPK